MKKVPKSLKVKTSETQWLQTKILQLQVMSLHPSRRNSQKLYNQPTPHALFYFSVGYRLISRFRVTRRARWGLWSDQNPIWASFLTGRPWVAILERFFGWVMWHWGWSRDFDDVGFWWRGPRGLIFSSAPKIDSDLPIPNHEIWIYDVQKRVTWHQKWSCDMENVTWWIMWHFRTIDVVLRCRTF